MAGKGGPNSWLGSLQLTPCLLICHTPTIVCEVDRNCDACLSWLKAREVLTPKARAITTSCLLRFILSPLLDWFLSKQLGYCFFATPRLTAPGPILKLSAEPNCNSLPPSTIANTRAWLEPLLNHCI